MAFPLGSIVRGALSFGVALALTPLASVLFPNSITAYFGGAFLLGATAAIGFRSGAGDDSDSRTAAAYGVGFVFAVAMILFSLVSVQGGGRPDFAWGAIAGGIGLGVAGAIGGASVRLALAIPGFIVFGLGGVIGGFLSFKALDMEYGLEGLVVAWGVGGAIAGGLFGAVAAASSR